MTIASIGYDGTVDEVQAAKLFPATGAGQYGVVSEDAWEVTAHPSTDKAVLVGPGDGWGPGVYDSSDASATVQCAALASGTRWDLITAKRDWQQTPGGTTTFSNVTGGAVLALPARLNSPGEQDEQPLALVQWKGGQTQPEAIIDLRCWAGNGGLFAKHTEALNYLERIGARVKIAGETWSYELLANDIPGWVNEDGAGPWQNLALNAGWLNNGASVTRARILARGQLLHVYGDVRYTGGPNIFEGWIIADLPGALRPKEQTFVSGTTNGYNDGAVYSVYPGGIAVGPRPAGTTCQFNGLAALK